MITVKGHNSTSNQESLLNAAFYQTNPELFFFSTERQMHSKIKILHQPSVNKWEKGFFVHVGKFHFMEIFN